MDAQPLSDTFLFEGFRLDRRSGLFRRDNGAAAPITIGSRALDILGVLIARAGEVVSKDEIIGAVWPGTAVEDSNLTVQVSALRRVLDRDRSEGSCIQTVAGRGYRFVPAVTRPGLQFNSDTAIGSKARTSPAPRLSIIVLPFTNLSDDRKEQYLADGITDDLITDLSRLPNMFVISQNTAFSYRGKPVDTKQIGRELGVRYVLEGSIRRSGSLVRVNVHLIDADTDAHLWAERYDSHMGELFALQDDITGRIAAALDIELVAAEASRPIEQPDALHYILRGRAIIRKPPSVGNYAKAIAFFEQALALDPRSVEARSRLAIALAARILDQMADLTASNISYAERLVEQTLLTSPDTALAHLAKGEVLRLHGRCEEAIQGFETAAALRRNWPMALSQLGWSKLLVGSLKDAISLQEQAIRLNPRDSWGYFHGIGAAHLLQSRIDEAILWLEKARNANPTLPHAHSFLAAAYALNGEAKAAALELGAARKIRGPGFHSSIAHLKTTAYFGVPRVHAQFDATFFAGLRKVGVPEN
jgi:TolB-like protein/Flp pilus assembly protein TadD